MAKRSKQNKRVSGTGWSVGGNEVDEAQPAQEVALALHQLRVRLEKRKQGKVVTVVKPFYRPEAELRALLKTLKSSCGGGGSMELEESAAQLVLQGDHVAKLQQWFKDNGWGVRL